MTAVPAQRVLVTGATGLVGAALTQRLVAREIPLRILSRDPARAARQLGAGVEARGWDGQHPAAEDLRGLGAIVHLAGEPLFGGRLTPARRRLVRDSRVGSTRALVDGLASLSAGERPQTLLCASAVGYYGDRGEEELDEAAAPGAGFLADLCRDWEAEAARAEDLGMRVLRLRIAVVLAREGGALALMRTPFRLGLGGRLGPGTQGFPWIHLQDLLGLIERALEQPDLRGALNACAPQLVTNAEFTRALATRLRRPALLPVPAAVLRLALGELAGELLGSRRVLPRRALAAGFPFAFPTLETALADLLPRD